MNLTDEELTNLEKAKGTPEWNDIIDEIKQARQGAYPPDWAVKVIDGILHNQGIEILTFSTKAELLDHLYSPEKKADKPANQAAEADAER